MTRRRTVLLAGAASGLAVVGAAAWTADPPPDEVWYRPLRVEWGDMDSLTIRRDAVFAGPQGDAVAAWETGLTIGRPGPGTDGVLRLRRRPSWIVGGLRKLVGEPRWGRGVAYRRAPPRPDDADVEPDGRERFVRAPDAD